MALPCALPPSETVESPPAECALRNVSASERDCRASIAEVYQMSSAGKEASLPDEPAVIHPQISGHSLRWLRRHGFIRLPIGIIDGERAVADLGRLRRDAIAEKHGIRARISPVRSLQRDDDVIERPASAAALREEERDIGEAVAAKIPFRFF